MSDTQDKFKVAFKKAQDLLPQIGSDPEAAKSYELAMAEVRGFKKQIEEEAVMGEVEQWATKSGGMLQLTAKGAGNAELVGSVPAGEAHVGKTAKGVTLLDDEGPGYVDEKMLRIISAGEYKAAFRQYLRVGQSGLKSDALKVLQEGIDTQGGYLVPEDILSKIIAKEPSPTNVAGRVTQLQTSRDALIIPKVNYSSATDDSSGFVYTTGIRVTWTGEIPATATTARVTEPVFGQIRIPVYTSMMSMPLTNDMIEDSAFPIVGWSSGKFSETVDLVKDGVILNGTGAGQPSGILLNPGGTNQPGTVSVGSAGNYTSDGIIAIGWTLPPQYDNNAVFVFNKTGSGKQVAQLKDGTGRYLWGAGMQDSGLVPGIRDRRLLGYDVLMNQQVADPSSSGYPLIFGDLTGYYLLNRVGFSIQVLRELYAETNQILLLGRMRLGGEVAEDWKIKVGQT